MERKSPHRVVAFHNEGGALIVRPSRPDAVAILSATVTLEGYPELTYDYVLEVAIDHAAPRAIVNEARVKSRDGGPLKSTEVGNELARATRMAIAAAAVPAKRGPREVTIDYLSSRKIDKRALDIAVQKAGAKGMRSNTEQEINEVARVLREAGNPKRSTAVVRSKMPWMTESTARKRVMQAREMKLIPRQPRANPARARNRRGS